MFVNDKCRIVANNFGVGLKVDIQDIAKDAEAKKRLSA